MKPGQHTVAFLIRVQFDIISHRSRGVKADDRFGSEPLLGNDLIEQGLRIIKQRLCFLAVLRMVENVRITPLELPRLKERSPINPFNQLFQRIIIEGFCAGKGRSVAYRVGPVKCLASFFCLVKVKQLGAVTGLPSRLADGFVFILFCPAKCLTVVLLHQLAHHTNGTRGILDVGHGVIVLRIYFDGGVRDRGRRSADQQRYIETLLRHLFGDRHHFVERRCDKTAQTDNVRLLLDGGIKNFLKGHHDAQIDHLVVVATQHHADNVLADVVDVAFDGSEDDFAV